MHPLSQGVGRRERKIVSMTINTTIFEYSCLYLFVVNQFIAANVAFTECGGVSFLHVMCNVLI